MGDLPDRNETQQNLDILTEYLKKGSYEDAVVFIKNEESKDWFSNASWDVIPLVTQYINPDNEENKPKLVKCCQDILEGVAQVCSPEEALFELLDKLECQDNDVLLLSLLQPVDIILNRLPTRRIQSLEWCLTALKESLAVIDFNNQERVINVFSKIEEFYKIYCSKVSTQSALHINDDPIVLEDYERERQLLACFLMQLLAMLGPHEPRPILDNIVKSLAQVLPSMATPMTYFMEYRVLSKHVKEDSHFLDQVPGLGFEILYYMVFHHYIGIESFPAVYNPQYIFNIGIVLSLQLLESTNEDLQKKGLSLFEGILKQISPGNISHHALSSPCNEQIFKCISKIMIFNPSKDLREFCTSLLKKYIIVFDAKGRFLFIQNAIIISEHSGIIGYLITQIKEFALEYISTKNYFITHLASLLCTACKLEKGKETLLFEHSDSIISALNVIRFLIIKDPKPGNLNTGIWNIEKYLKDKYTNVISEALVQSREYLKVQLSDAKCLEETEKANKGKTANLKVRIGNEVLPYPKYDDEVRGIHAKNNTLDFIEFQLNMVNENW